MSFPRQPYTPAVSAVFYLDYTYGEKKEVKPEPEPKKYSPEVEAVRKLMGEEAFQRLRQSRLELARLGEWELDAVDDLGATPTTLERERGHWIKQPEPVTDWGICTTCLVPFRSLNGHADFYKTRPDWEKLTEPPCGHSPPREGGQTQFYLLRFMF